MKWLFMIASFAIVACSGFAHERKNHGNREIAANQTNRSLGSVAILELFTSEGCSSCPPADRLLPQLAGLDSNVIPLSFHVDYWNHLGWTDPFSRAEFSKKQREYADRFHLESIYTPELIINGEYELVGSSRSTAEADIKRALGEKVTMRISIDELKKTGNKLSISAHLNGDLTQATLTSVLVQKKAETNVRAGENIGRKLSHTNVVRAFLQQPCQPKMQFEMEIPKELSDINTELIFYVQRKDLKVIGATVVNNE